jgi:hypothetical protein
MLHTFFLDDDGPDLPPVAMFFSSDGLSTDGGSFSGGGSTNVDGDIQQKYIYLHMCMHACMHVF